MDKFLQIADNQKFGGADNFEFSDVDEQTFQQYMKRLPIWDFLKVSKGSYLSLSREDKLAAINNYIRAMRNANTNTLSGEFIFVCKYKLLPTFVFFVCLFLVWAEV